MAASIGKTHCVNCNKEKATLRCGGCFQDFCHKHLEVHRQELHKQLDEIEINRDNLRQSLTQQIEQPNKRTLIQQVDQWEQNAINIIQQTAEQARQIVIENTNEYINQIELKLNKLTDQLRESRDENDFNEINLRHFQEELSKLENELNKPPNIIIQEDPTFFINKISAIVPESTVRLNIYQHTKWNQNGITVAGGNGQGNKLNQLDYPISVYVDDDQNVFVVDCGNDRIVEWRHDATDGYVVAGGNGKGAEMNQLNRPIDMIVDKETNHLIICDRGNRRIVQWPLQNGTTGQTIISDIDCCRLMMDNNGHMYISDLEKHEVRRWNIGHRNGTLVAGGNGHGKSLNQLNNPSFIFVNRDRSVYVSDYGNHRVMKWMEGADEGIVVAGGQKKGNDLTQLSCSEGLLVDHLGTIYVADSYNHRIMRWCKGATQGDIVVGGNGAGEKTNQLNYPIGLSFDRQGNLYVVDHKNHRVQKFNIDRS